MGSRRLLHISWGTNHPLRGRHAGYLHPRTWLILHLLAKYPVACGTLGSPKPTIFISPATDRPVVGFPSSGGWRDTEANQTISPHNYPTRISAQQGARDAMLNAGGRCLSSVNTGRTPNPAAGSVVKRERSLSRDG